MAIMHMHSAADLQARFARAMIGGELETLTATLVGGGEPRKRLAIHQRHYETSLVQALLQKFPALAQIVGADAMAAAARAYVRACVPETPCIAEYGHGYPAFLSANEPGRPYLESFGALEWAVGKASIAIDFPPIQWSDLALLQVHELLDATVTLQPGLRYVCSSWSVDELMTKFLAEPGARIMAPRQLDVGIEVRGCRGAVSLRHLDPAAYAFRAALADGRSIGAAAEAALERDAGFDAGAALRELVSAGLVSGLSAAAEEVDS
jgi:hypothetical protein